MPRYAQALLGAIGFSNTSPELLDQLDDAEWSNLLDLADKMQLTLLFGYISRRFLPWWVSARIDRNYSNNGLRFSRLKAALAKIGRALTEHSIPFAVLKGFTHSSHFCPHPGLRSQGDIDIWCPPDLVFQARDVLAELGYRPIGKSKGRHLDPMIRETSWEWTGDYFAPDLPIPVDLHYQLWDEVLEHIAGPNEAEIWKRRCSVVMGGGQVASQLELVDALAFASLHVLMHLLHGDLRLQRSWELAFFLQKHSNDSEFWSRWRCLYSHQERQMQVIPFALGHKWFGCLLPTCIRREISLLPDDVLFWLRHYSWSPVESLFAPNKDELLLNLSLLRSVRSRAHVFARRMLPVYAALSAFPPESRQRDFKSTMLISLSFTLRRAVHHLRGLPLACWRTAAWWWRRQRLGRDSTYAFSARSRALSIKHIDDGRR